MDKSYVRKALEWLHPRLGVLQHVNGVGVVLSVDETKELLNEIGFTDEMGTHIVENVRKEPSGKIRFRYLFIALSKIDYINHKWYRV